MEREAGAGGVDMVLVTETELNGMMMIGHSRLEDKIDRLDVRRFVDELIE